MDLPELTGFYWQNILSKENISEEQLKRPKILPSSVQGINHMSKRLHAAGGPAQQSRMIQDKRKTLDRVLKASYQGAFVKKYIQDYVPTMDGVREGPPPKALINPNKLKPDYDEKIISIPFEQDFHSGDVFEWLNTGTFWLIYLQDLTELAYFRGETRRCSYIIKWLDENGNEKFTYAAVRGPVETKIESLQKNGITTDQPNWSLNMMIPKNKDTLKWCQRYAKFLLSDGENTICWRIEAVNAFSMPGVIEFNAVEYYINRDEDDIEEKLVGGNIPKGEILTLAIDPEEEDIIGEGFIQPKSVYTYVYEGTIEDGEWKVEKGLPLVYKCSLSNDGKPQIHIKWNKVYSGQFDLTYTNGVETVSKTIVIQSLF